MPKNFRTNIEQPKHKYIPLGNRVVMKCPDVRPSSSKPIHSRRIEQALNLQPFLQSFNNRSILSSDSDESDDDNASEDAENVNSMLKDAEPNSTKEYYNFKNVSANRKWLADVLSEDTENCNEEANYKYVLSLHAYQKKIRRARNRVNFDASLFYGAGLVSTVDHYPDIEKSLPSIKKPKPVFRAEDAGSKSPLYEPDILDDISNEPCLELNLENGINEYPNLDEDISDTPKHPDYHTPVSSLISHIPQISSASSSGVPRRKNKKFRDEEAKKKWEDMMTVKRRKLFTNIVKKEIGKQHRSKTNKHKEMLLQCKRVASHCVKYARQKALQSAKLAKEQQWRMKRLARENLAYWKRSRRFDREVKKRLEKEAEEQRKIDHELIEAKRQQRKLNFLITQTELYAHFMSKKLGTASAEEQLKILSQLDEERNTRIVGDDYDSEEMKAKAKRNAQEAFMNERARTRDFDQEANSCLTDVEPLDGEQPQPSIFKGILKGYQLKGMNWLANLYSQGISGILADEMGLGKTVQSIAFLCHIAEKYSVWGPFLIISPASTLHNWQQEIAKFVPEFKVVPYWGNPNERKILRQFWDQKDIYTKDASFHIVITSYQIVITDIKYFNRIKWQYMILDEAQAIKSTNSMRWKTLLGFSCRNRLLLSGTPIQNSMAELWALLHFIMPTLFDSHEEFNEWFSKDIESHAENKTGIDEKHLSRLHMILKPFMLRRIKKDVENELSDKIEVMVYCPLTTRQSLLYMALKQKIKIEDLLHYSVGGGDSPHTVDKNFTSNLMNLVMQFRKVCNHPELFERRDAKSPIRVQPIIYNIPYLIYNYNIRKQNMLKINKKFIFTPRYISTAVFDPKSIFYFCIDLNVSSVDFFRILIGDIAHRYKHYYETEKQCELLYHRKLWHTDLYAQATLNLQNEFRLLPAQIESSLVLSDLVFVRYNKGNRVIYTHIDHIYYSMPETVEHRNIRIKKDNDDDNVDMSDRGSQVTDFPHISKPPQVFRCEKTELPSFLFCGMPRVSVAPLSLYCYSRRAAWDYQRHITDFSFNSLNGYWSHCTGEKTYAKSAETIYPRPFSCVDSLRPHGGWSNIVIPDKESLVTDSGKLSVLDGLLRRLKEEGHRVLIYSQMTKMIDLLEEYMWHRHHKYMRLDGSSKISERRDMVADFQARTDIFVFLLSTRAGGLGINLTAADTVIFYDSDWNPTVDQQAMDRAHRLGQTKQVTVYRLICKGTIEERILQRAREKSEIQKLVISGGNFKPDTLKPKEVVSLLLDDEELVQKYHLKVENKISEEVKDDRKRKMPFKALATAPDSKRLKQEPQELQEEPTEGPSGLFVPQANGTITSGPNSPGSVASSDVVTDEQLEGYDETSESLTNKYTVYNVYGSAVKPRIPGRGVSRRGRPRGSRSRTGGLGRTICSSNASATSAAGPLAASSSGSASGVFSVDQSGAGRGDSTLPSSARPSPVPFQEAGGAPASAASAPPGAAVRRGPGRPRLKPSGPANAGCRGAYRPRKPAKPLPVPLMGDPTAGLGAGTSYSAGYSYYDFADD